jgi:anthranilate phosphoribosyltransferase
VREGVNAVETWPALSDLAAPAHEESLDLARVRALWRGNSSDEMGTLAVIGTAAIALWTLGRADNPEAAHALAATLWQNRDTSC